MLLVTGAPHKVTTTSTAPGPTLPSITEELPDPCLDGKLDAIILLFDNTVYAFRQNYYVKLISTGIAPGYPRPITQDWNGIPDDIDAAFAIEHKNYKRYEMFGEKMNHAIYFFKGNNVYLYDRSKRQLISGYPKQLEDVFPSVPDYVDSAFFFDTNKVIITKGNVLGLLHHSFILISSDCRPQECFRRL